MRRQFDVALSFAGEDRKHAEELAILLKSGEYSVFYDEYEPARLWGRNLYDYLSSIYKDQARYCVMFLSKHYKRKLWTNHERQNAQARAFEDNQEYILPVRVDDTEIPGILPTTGYLDLRSRTIEEIYLILVDKLSGSTSQAPPTDISTLAAESDRGEFVLFRPENGNQYFVPFREASWNSTGISLELLPESTEQAAFLRSLRNNVSDRFARDIFAFAQQEDAAWVSPLEVVQTTAGSQTVWKVVLKEDITGQDSSLSNEIVVNNISADQIAEMRARRILLNEKPNLSDQEMLEPFIRGLELSGPESGLQVLESPIPSLYRSFGQMAKRFRKFARLASVLYLKLSNTVDEILQFDLEILNRKELQVGFEGRRPKIYMNVEPSILEVNGICPLSE